MITIAKTIQNNLSELAVKNERIMLLAVRDWFDFVIRQLRRDLRLKFKKDIAAEFTDWRLIEGEGIKNIRPATLKVMQTGGKEAYNTLAVQGSFSVLNVKAVEAASKMCAELVREITDQTRKGIRLYVREGIKDGKSMPKLGRELRPLVGLTENQTQSVVNYRRLLEDKEKYPRLKPTDIDRKVQRYADKTHRRRATTIARTETAKAQNIGYCQGLAENGVEQVEFLPEPNACDDCLALDGKKYSVAEGENIIPVHPNCRCAMLPVIDEQALADSLEEPKDLVPDTPPDIPGPEGFDYEAAGTDKQLNWEDRLTSAQLTSFDEYTAGETQKILAAQRRVLSGLAPSKLSAAEKVWYGHAQQMELALQRAPGFKGQIWRGMQFKNDKDPRLIALNRRLTSKKPFTFDTTTSFTGSKDFAAMVNQWDRVDDANKVKVMVRMKKAPKRSAYMGNLSGVEDEAEILVSARTKYKVVGRSEKMVGKTRYIQYELEEVLPKIKPKLIAGREPTFVYTDKPFNPRSVVWKKEFKEAIDSNKFPNNFWKLGWTDAHRKFAFKTIDDHLNVVNAKVARYQTAKNWERSVTTLEKQALSGYQGGHEWTAAIKSLQSGKIPYTTVRSSIMARAKRALPQLEALINRAPNFRGNVFRGMRITSTDIAKLKRRGTMTFDSIASGSTSEKQAVYFVERYVVGVYNSNKTNVLLNIEAKTAVRLGKISSTDPGLEETFIRKGTKYKIKSIRTFTHRETGQHWTHINLVEI